MERLLQVRIRRISLFDINKHREEMEKIEGGPRRDAEESQEPHASMSSAIWKRCWKNTARMYPRLTTKSARHEEVDVKAVAFKSFKVAYDRESGYVGYKVNGDEFKLECTKFDKVLLVFKDGTYKVSELPEKLFVGPELFYCGLPDRETVFTCAYTDRKASYLKRFKFGGTILNKAYLVHPGQVAHPVLRAGHAESSLRPLQTRAAPEDQPADVRPSEDRSQKSEDARPADFHQGHLLRDRRTDARLGREGDDDGDCVCLKGGCEVERACEFDQVETDLITGRSAARLLSWICRARWGRSRFCRRRAPPPRAHPD